MDLWRFKPNKEGWSKVLELTFPSYIFWGILTLIGMIASIGNGAKYAIIVQIASTLFFITGIFRLSKMEKTEVQ